MDRDYLKEKRILLVDDEQELLDMVCSILKEEGYQNLCTASCMKEAMEKAAVFSPELAVLDVMLPDGSGFELFEKLKQMGDFPVLFLTACGEDEDKFRGLGLGADDYMVKPFALDELLARLRALTRRNHPDQNQADETLTFSNLTLSPTTREVTRGGRHITLTRTEFALLQTFMKNPTKVLERSWLLNEVWGFEFPTTANSLEVYIGYLRRKTEQGGEPRLIHTVRGVGYVLREAAS